MVCQWKPPKKRQCYPGSEAEGRPGPSPAPRLRHDVMALRFWGAPSSPSCLPKPRTPGGEEQHHTGDPRLRSPASHFTMDPVFFFSISWKHMHSICHKKTPTSQTIFGMY